ncbi:MAG: NERD domain-containing protein, partial [Deltaproteobacteria bacterium]|nr:NERD domain-containing protein [Deltaproteobacteria bacterium]
MAMSPDRWTAITESQFPWERDALEYIRQGLPDRDPFRAWATFEFIADDGSINEVDLLVLTPKGFFLTEIKNRPGAIDGDAGTWSWTFEGKRHTEDSPLLRANKKAKRLAALLQRQPACKKTRVPFLQPLVFCSPVDQVSHLTGLAKQGVYLRDRDASAGKAPRLGILHALAGPQTSGQLPSKNVDRPMAKVLTWAMEQAGIRPSQRHRRVGDYLLG